MGIFDKIKKTKKKSEDDKPKEEKVVATVKVGSIYGKESNSDKSDASKKTSVVDENKSVVPKGVSKGDAYKVIVNPLVTEKSSKEVQIGKYVFEVFGDANKVLIKKAIKKMYGVTPLSVNISNYKGKKVRLGRIQGKRSNWKKAIVTLAKGKTINIEDV